MELKVEFSPDVEREIEEQLKRGMYQTAVFLTIKHLKECYDLTLPDYNCMRIYALAKSVLRNKFPEFFPQMHLSL